jgi:hypothetical protein
VRSGRVFPPGEWPGQVDANYPAYSAYSVATPITRIAQTMAWVLAVTAVVICFGPLWGLDHWEWLILQVPGAFLALMQAGLLIDDDPPAPLGLWVSLTASAAEAGLIMFVFGTLPALLCVAIGVVPFVLGLITSCFVMDAF